MAREAYLRGDDDQSTLHDNVITLDTKKEKFKNWWYYNKLTVLIVTAVVVAVVVQVVNVLSEVEPDYTIAFASDMYVDDDMIVIMETELAAYGVDTNGDGEVIVDVICYFLTSSADYSEDLEGAVVQLYSDLTLGTTMIWIMDDSGYVYLDADGDGSLLYEVYEDAEDTKVMEALEISALANLDVSSYTYDYDTDAEVDADALIETLFGGLDVVLRTVEGTSIESDDTLEILDYHIEFIQNLVSNTKVSE